MKRWRESWTQRERVRESLYQREAAICVSEQQTAGRGDARCLYQDWQDWGWQETDFLPLFPTLWARQVGRPCAVMPPQPPDAAVLLRVCVSQKYETLSPAHPQKLTLNYIIIASCLCLQNFCFIHCSVVLFILFSVLFIFHSLQVCLVSEIIDISFRFHWPRSRDLACYKSDSFERISSFG